MKHVDKAGANPISGPAGPAVGPSGRRRTWRRAMSGMMRAALRLQHYRSLRTRLLHDALNGRMDGPAGGGPADGR